jgi:putative transposase
MTGRGQGSRDRVVAIFKGRSKAVPVQKDTHFLEVCRYVVLNPVRAKTVRHPQWKWIGYGVTGGLLDFRGCL